MDPQQRSLPSLVFTRLDTENATEVERYEKAMFRAFYDPRDPAVLATRIIDRHARRMRLKIPYERIETYVVKFGESVVGGLTVNRRMDGPLQLETLGFSIDKSEPGVCEGMALFALPAGADPTVVARCLRSEASRLFRGMGMRKVYGTCTKKKLRGYLNLGWMVAAEGSFEGVREYLICLEQPSTPAAEHA